MRAKHGEYQRRREAIEAQQALEKEGLVLASKPRYEAPRLPTNLSDLTDDVLMDLFVRYTRWADYANGQLALAMIEERAAEALLASAEATALVGNWGGGKDDSVNVAKAKRELDPEVIKMRDEHQVAYARRKIIESIFTNAERDSAVVSRELTRRVGRMEVNERRTNRWQP